MINKLVANIKKTGAPIVVGLDPNLAFVPEHIQKKAFDEYGETLEGAAEAIWQFNKADFDAVTHILQFLFSLFLWPNEHKVHYGNNNQKRKSACNQR